MAEDYDEQEMYLYVDFAGKVPEDILRKKIYFRMTDLHKDTALVQLNDYLFKGKIEDCIGTNLFFEEIEDRPPKTNVFDRETPIHLKHYVTQFKNLTLQSVKIPSKARDIPEPQDTIKINTQYDYETLLKKLADGSLNLEEMVVIEEIPPVEPETHITAENEIVKDRIVEIEPKKINSEDLCNNETTSNILTIELNKEPEKEEMVVPEPIEYVDILSFKYEKLRNLARRPTKRAVVQDPIAECDAKYRKAYDYNSIKSQIIQPSDAFPVISKNFNCDTFEGAVDIDRSILQGIIPGSTEIGRVLTQVEKDALLTLENLGNLSIPARYWVLKTQLQHIEQEIIPGLSEAELQEEDQYGRTLYETISIYKRLLRVLNGLTHQNYFYNSEEETDNEEDCERISEEFSSSVNVNCSNSMEVNDNVN